MPKFKDHPVAASLLFLILSLIGIWAMGSLFNSFASKWTWLFAAVFFIIVVVLSLMMKWAEKDIQAYRRR